jgi:hypothetical protein
VQSMISRPTASSTSPTALRGWRRAITKPVIANESASASGTSEIQNWSSKIASGTDAAIAIAARPASTTADPGAASRPRRSTS